MNWADGNAAAFFFNHLTFTLSEIHYNLLKCMCFPFTVQKCGVDLLQTAFRLTLIRFVSIHQTMTPHLNRMTFMSALCKMLRIYSAKATRRDSTFIRRT